MSTYTVQQDSTTCRLYWTCLYHS